MTLLIITLILTFAISFWGIFFLGQDQPSDKQTPPKKTSFIKQLFSRSMLFKYVAVVLNIGLLYASYQAALKEAEDNIQLKLAVETSTSILGEANAQLNNQAKLLASEFDILKKQLAAQGVHSSSINNSLQLLANNLDSYTDGSQRIFSSLTETLTTKFNDPDILIGMRMGEDGRLIVKDSVFAIPAGYTKGVEITQQNHLAIVENDNTDHNRLRVRINGYSNSFFPSDRKTIIGSTENEKYHLVYNGLINNRYSFSLLKI